MAAAAGAPVRREVEVRNRKGLHARAAAQFVKTAGRFLADIDVTFRDQSVSGRSIMGLMMLAAAPGSVLLLEARGEDAEEAVQSLVDLVAAGFGEES